MDNAEILETLKRVQSTVQLIAYDQDQLTQSMKRLEEKLDKPLNTVFELQKQLKDAARTISELERTVDRLQEYIDDREGC